MSIIIPSTTPGPGKIGYENLFTTSGVTVTSSTETTGFEAANAYDWLGYSYWTPTATGDSWIRASFASAQNANYCAVWGHNLADHGSSCKPQYSTNGGSSWIDAASAVMPADNDTLWFSWDTIPGADWRLLVTNPTTIASIAGVQIGEALQFTKGMQPGFAPASLVPNITLKTTTSESGVFIGGRKVSEGIEGAINLGNIDPTWVRSTWIPFIDHVQTPRPFVFAWDDVTHQTEVVLGWGTKPVPKPKYQDPLYMTISLMFEGTR